MVFCCAFGYKMSPQTSTNEAATLNLFPFSQLYPREAVSRTTVIRCPMAHCQGHCYADVDETVGACAAPHQGFIHNQQPIEKPSKNNRDTIKTNNRDTYSTLSYIYIYTINIHQWTKINCKITVTYENHDDSTCTCVVVSLQASHPPLSLESGGVSEFQRP
jgi:hypothetical protein